MIEFRNVTKTYDTGTKAVKNANFVIDKGEFAFLVGSSGSGKSTLIKLILKEEEHQYSDGVVKEYTSLGYKYITYNRKSKMGYEFGGFWLKVKEQH